MISHAGKLGCLLDVVCYIRLHTRHQNLGILRFGGNHCKTNGIPWFPAKPSTAECGAVVLHTAGQKSNRHRICCIRVQY